MRKSNLPGKVFLFSIVLFLSSLQVHAADRYSVATGNWNATTTWSAASGGGSGASVPGAGDIVHIERGYTVTITAAAACASITIYSGSTLVSGTFIFTITGTWVKNGTFTPGGGTVNFNSVNAQINAGTGAANFNIITIGLSTDNAVPTTLTINTTVTCTALTLNQEVGTTVNTLTISGTNQLTVSGAVTLTTPVEDAHVCTLNVGAGTLGCGSVSLGGGANAKKCNLSISTGTVNVSGNITFTNTGSNITFTDAGKLNIAGTFVGATGTLTPSTGTVNFNGTAAQTIPIGVSAVIYHHLTFNNTNASGATLSAAVTATNVTGNISVGDVSSGSLLNSGNFAVTFGASKTLTVAANSTLNAGTSVISFGATGTAAINGTFKTANTIGFSGSATTAINSTNTPTINLGASSTIEYNAAGNQAVTARTYNNLALSGSGNKTILTATTINKNLSISGTAKGLLNNGGTSTAETLTLGGVNQLAGTWSSNGYTGTSNKNDTWFVAANTGIINVTGGCTVGSWSGNISTDWATASNWCSSTIPTSTIDVTIPSGTPFQPTIGAAAVCKNITINSGATLTFSGSNTLTVHGNWSNSGTLTAGTGTVAFNNSPAAAQTITGTTGFNNLTINNTAGVTLGSELITVNGILNLLSANASATQGTLHTGTYTLNMGASATTDGTGDVTGIVRRTSFALVTPYSFGNKYTTLNITSGTLPTEVSYNIVLSATHTWKTNAINRYYDISQTGGNSTTKVTLNLHYLDGTELNGATEGSLDLFDYHVSAQVEDHGQSNFNTSENWVGLANLSLTYVAPNSSFGSKYWTLGTSGVTDNFTWIGASSVWDETSNWHGAVIPTYTDHVVIPGGTTFNPVLPAATSIGSIIIQSGGILNATTGTPTLTIAGGANSWQNQGTFNAGTSSTVKFTNANAYMSGTTAFYNVTVDNGASLTLGTDNIMRIAGTLTLTGTGILAAANNHNTVEYNGAAQNVINPNGTTPGYHNLILSRTINTMPGTALTILGDFSMSGTASATAGAAMTIGGNVTIGSGTTFNASTFSHLFGGNLTNDGTFTGATSTITFNGTAAQTIGGSVASAFNNLTVTNTSAAVLVNTNTNIGGTLFMDGATTTLTPGAAVVFNNAGAAGTITGSGTVQVTRTASTADYSSQYIFSTNTLTNLTVEYAVPTGSQVVSALTYGSLKLDNTSGTNTTGGVITSGGTFTTTAGGTLNMGSNALTVYAVAHSGILTTQNTSATPLTTGKTWGGTVQYDASAAQTVAAGTYNNLNLSNSGEKTTTSATVNGILSMEGTATASAAPTYGSDATLQYNTATARAAGVEWITPFVATGGVIIANSGTITMTGAKVLSGSVPLTINNGASLTIDAAGALTVDGTLTNNAGVAGLVIKSISSGTGSLINSSTGVSATVERYMTGGTTPWHLISSPVEGQDIHAFVDATANAVATNSDKYGLAPYVTSTPGWAHYTASTIESAGNFVSGQGYEVLRSADGTVSFAGTIPTGAVSPSVYYNAASKWWNILGNPYSSSIMINPLAGSSNFLTANSGILETGYGAIYIWNADESTPVYDIINNVTAYYVPPGQSFFVHTKSGASTASFTAAMRTHSTSGFKSSQTIWPSINLNATIAGNNKNTRIYYIPGTTLGIDEGYDAGIFEDNNPLIALSTHIQGSNIDFGIQSLPDNDYENIVVPVGLNAPNGSAVVFSADAINLPANTKVYLEDKLTKKFTRLDEAGTSYSIQLSSASKGTGRFYLHTKQGAMGIDENEKDNITAIPLPQEQIIRIIGPVEPSSLATLYDMNGRMLVSVTLHNYSDNEIAFTPVSDGIYLLQIQSGTTLVKRKICWVR